MQIVKMEVNGVSDCPQVKEAEEYVIKHRIIELFVNLTELVVFNKPGLSWVLTHLQLYCCLCHCRSPDESINSFSCCTDVSVYI